MAELSDADGTRIHRSHWIADRAVAAGRRAGRGWEVLLPCGTALRVSASYREEAKRRGWLSRRAA
jgi:DNA-binding LytR/AlgR family response regulator